ncbi:ribonuclease H-like domain-containing protein [Tanacetum coccineum]
MKELLERIRRFLNEKNVVDVVSFADKDQVFNRYKIQILKAFVAVANKDNNSHFAPMAHHKSSVRDILVSSSIPSGLSESRGINCLSLLVKSSGNPLHLHPNDSNYASIVTVKLTGVENYRIWVSAMKLALQIKHKMGFITGTCARSYYLTSAPLLDQWDRCNAVVLNWILTSLSQDVYLGHVFSDNAYKVWNELKETYDRVDGSIVFNLLQKINSFKQGSLPVFEYYHKLNSLWREFDALTKLPDCTCEARNEVVDHGNLMKLMQFLMGLDDVYQPIRSSILTREILPKAKDAFVIISREESYRGIPASSSKTEKPQVSAFNSKVNDNNKRKGSGNWSNGNNSSNWSTRNNSNRGNYDSLLCKNCGLKGHIVDRCFEIIGDVRGSSVGNNDTFSSPLSLSNEQMLKLMSLLNDKSSPAANANMAGIDSCSFFNCNVFFNQHFYRFYYVNIKVNGVNYHLGWIIDSKANQHMTNDTKNMFNLIDVSGLKLNVGHPHGTLAKITHVGNLKLNNDVILFDVLVVPEYIVSLLFVNKLIKDSKLSVCFDESNCYIQDLRKGKVLGTGSEFVGLYLFDEKFNVHVTAVNSEYFCCYVSKDVWHNDVKFYETVFPYKMNNETDCDLNPGVTELNFFDNFKSESSSKTPNESPSDDEEGTSVSRESSLRQPESDVDNESGSDVRMHQPVHDVVIFQPGHGEQQTATPIGEKTQFEGNVPKNNEVPTFQNVFENQKEEVSLRRSSRVSKLPAKLNDYVLNNIVKYGLRKFINAMNNEMQALYEIGTWELVDLPIGRKAIGKTFSLMVKMSTVRCLIDLAVQNDWKLFQMDVNNAFLYGSLSKDVYMLPPFGFFDKNDKRVFKLKKSLYGLKQAPRQWNHKLYETLIRVGFEQSKNDHSLYIKNNGDVSLNLLVYVDDLVITGNSETEIEKFKTFLNKKFKIKDLGELKYFLGIEDLKTKNGLYLNQRKYYLELLLEFGLLACRPGVTLLSENIVLSHKETDDDKFLKNITSYQKLAGKLIYLCMTRPDISYVIYRLSQHMHAPLHSHFDLGLRLTNPGFPGRLVAGDSFPGRHVARDKWNGKARIGYLPE